MAAVQEFRSTITPVLTVRDAAQAVVFYGRAFGAEEIYRSTYPDGRIVAEMAADPFGHHWLIGRPLAGKAGAWARGPGR